MINLGKDTFTAHRGGEEMETKLARIAEMAKANPKFQFTSIGHFINAEMLIRSHEDMETGKATGVDEVTKETYDMNLEENVRNLEEPTFPRMRKACAHLAFPLMRISWCKMR